MHLKRLYYTVTKVMCYFISRTCGALPHGSIHCAQKGEQLLSNFLARNIGYVYTLKAINCAILFHLYLKTVKLVLKIICQ